VHRRTCQDGATDQLTVTAIPISVIWRKYGRSEIVFTMSSHYVPAHYVTAQVNINLLPETMRVSNLEHINESCAVGEIPCFFQIYSLYS
jgi:hypothetical protein